MNLHKILNPRPRIFLVLRGMLALGRMIRKDCFEPAHEGLSFLFFDVDVELKSACVDVREKRSCACARSIAASKPFRFIRWFAFNRRP
jgi:hypothetical protein